MKRAWRPVIQAGVLNWPMWWRLSSTEATPSVALLGLTFSRGPDHFMFSLHFFGAQLAFGAGSEISRSSST